MPSTTVLARTRAYIAENFLYTRPDYQLADDDLLLERRIIDSMGMVELVTFLQDEFRIDIDEADITEENLGSLARIERYVRSKTMASEAA
jgi:acyl carrier protein